MLTKQIKLKHGVSAILILFLFTTLSFAGELTEQQSLKHGVSELGNIQVYFVTEIEEDGKIISSDRGIAYKPKDINNMEGWDKRSKDIVNVLNDKKVKEDFELEKQEMTGVGLEKIIAHDRTIKKDGSISIRRITRVFKDGKQISKKYHRSWIMPGDDPTNADVISKAVAMELHTPEVIMKYKEEKAKRELKNK